MNRVIAVVEGQTEQGFVREVLAPYLAVHGVSLTARLVGKPGHKGGVGAYQRARRDILLLLRQESDTVVTTMFDFYGMPNSWPGRQTAKAAPAAEKAAIVENAIRHDILQELGTSTSERRFYPYVQMHEFESLLFCDPATTCAVLRSAKSALSVQAIRDSFSTPEEINDDPNTAPSRRLERLFRAYRKRLHGLIAAQRIGIEKMLDQCPHFSVWVEKLRSFGDMGLSSHP